jgi:guanylate kinase
VLSAPSGAGKTTVARQLVKSVPSIGISRSFTTRAPRRDEVDGVDYDFIDQAEFDRMKAAGGFLECADVFGLASYGTGRENTERRLASGEDLILVIDVQGAGKLRADGVPFVGIFLMPPSYEALETRLRGRNDVSEEKLQRRLETARIEMCAVEDYDYVVVNDDLCDCVLQLRAIVLAQRSRRDVMRDEVTQIRATFGDLTPDRG